MRLPRWGNTAVKERVHKVAEAMPIQQETDLVVADKSMAITKKTPFEELLEKIRSEPVNLKRDIFRQIMAAYFFLRLVLKMTHRPITLEEFEIVHDRLKELAATAATAVESRLDARDFLKKGYFTSEDIIWIDSRSYCLTASRFPYNVPYNIHGNDYQLFNPESKPVRKYIEEDKYSHVIPPNILELMNEIFEKRHPELATPR